MGLILLTKDKILSDFLLLDCPLLTGVEADISALKKEDLCVLDADSFPQPYPASACLIISHKKQETQIPLLLRPLSPGALSRALGQNENGFDAYLLKKKRALVTEKEVLTFPPLEFALLEILFEKKGEAIPRRILCQHLTALQSGSSQAEDPNGLLTVYIYRLRKKLAPLGFSLISHRQNGYSLKI